MPDHLRGTVPEADILAHLAGRIALDEYSMTHTASGALHFGADEKKLLAAKDYKTSPLFTPAEKAVLDIAVAAGQTLNAITDAMFAELRKHWSEEQIVEIVSAASISAPTTGPVVRTEGSSASS